jgi:TolB-like protein/Flp pilus assembly protein TadD
MPINESPESTAGSAGADAHPEGARPTIFLSYARADYGPAGKLIKALQGAGFNVWWDSLIEGGATFAKSIETALANCNAVVVVWSASSVESDWVRDEAAKGRDSRKLVPVTLDGTAPPLGFGQYHAIDLRHWRGGSAAPEIASIARAVVALAGPTSKPPVLRAGRATVADLFTRRRVLVVAAAVGGAVGLAFWRRSQFLRGSDVDGSVAVLPFKNLSSDPEQVYFSDGLTEELRSTLARDRRLQVAAPISSGQFRDHKDSAVSVASQLGVSFLLEGSVQRAGEVLRIATTLINGRTGFSTWAQRFDRRMDDIFAVQSEIARTVSLELSARIGNQDAPNANRTSNYGVTGGTSNVAAFEAYLRGRALYDLSADEASERAALTQFEAALALDSTYAAAHAARSRSLIALANQYGMADQLTALYAAGIAAAERAIALAPDFADAHSTLGYALFQGRLDVRRAREPFARSRELGYGDATVMARYAQFGARIGQHAAATTAMRRALVLDPLNPLIYRAAGSIEFAARSYAASLSPLKRALEMNPRMSRAHAAAGDALLLLGRSAEARTQYLAEPLADVRLSGLAILEHREGKRAVAQAAMQRLIQELGDRVLYQQAQVLAQWGETGAALARLENAYRIGDSGLIYLRNDPFLDPLRAAAPFQKLLNRIGFE